MKAMILAAGFGTRLRPLTFQCPKPMFPILNRPILEHTIDLLRAHEIQDITVNLHHLPESITNYFGDGSQFGVRLHWSHEEDEILGTAGGIKAAQKFLDGDSFVVINSDVVVNIDLGKVIEYHQAQEAAVTMVLRAGTSPELCDPIEVDPHQRIVHMPGASSMNAPKVTGDYTFTGIQIMEPEIFERIPEGRFFGTTTHVFPEMIEDGRPFFAWVHGGYWADMGKPESYLQVHKDALDGTVKLAGAGATEIKSGATILPPVFIGDDCRIAESATLGPYAILGNKCTVDDGAVVENSVVWEGAVLSANCRVQNSIIGADATVAVGEQVSGKSVSAQ